MALASRRSRRPSIDIWPGFVDALAQLLMVIIFMLLVFTAGQFFLSDKLGLAEVFEPGLRAFHGIHEPV